MGYTHGTKWTNEKIEEEIQKVMNALNIKRMPSNSEMRMVTGSYALSNKLIKTGGIYHWADKLGLKIKVGETQIGTKYQDYIANKLNDMGFEIEMMSTKHPYDLLVNGNVKIDVKVARPYEHKEIGRFHTFNLEKKYPTCDIYISVALNDNDEIQRIFVIPSKYLKITQLSVGKRSKYNKYINKWDYIKEYDDFYKNIS